MQTINYQGQEVQATLVNYLSGTITTSTVDVEGDEELFRDEAGRYYLRRKLNLLSDYHEDHGEGNIPASGRTHVHRININAAILWATTRLKSETLDLRSDAAALLMENRGYTEEGSGARVRTIFDLDPLHAALLKKFTDDHGINVAVLVRACLMQQLQFTYNGFDREEEGAAVECLQEYGQLGSGPDAKESEHMRVKAGMAAPRWLVESEVAA